MQKLKSIKEFQAENPEATMSNSQLTYGGRNDVSLTHQDTPTAANDSNWNCGDITRQMMWDGTPSGAPFTFNLTQAID
ncbi:hypothetical protein LXD69_08475 [Flavobacterium sediminilitoris]|uniref:Uncharacterized protein n=1 Tax=Flavobacterium sediminilitoris TaxID=2024526 RepID=A0ABY4HS67_9FLAO|nr:MULTISPECIES: hypothetical protein [Flavobacterium]UOX35545.1 hypothetical protein LXD69_08475 [Flavobacterium sediminilitoris]